MKKSKSIECNICHLILTKKNFDRHMETHGKRECKECNQIFESQEMLDEHKTVHLCCPQCPELGPFQDKANLARHMETHRKKCHVCKQIVDSQEELDEHKTVHLCCLECPELGPFHDTATLNRHKREKHLEIPRHRQNCFQKFQNEVKYGPIFTCISCHRCLYENGVILCKDEQMKQFEMVLQQMIIFIGKSMKLPLRRNVS